MEGCGSDLDGLDERLVFWKSEWKDVEDVLGMFVDGLSLDVVDYEEALCVFLLYANDDFRICLPLCSVVPSKVKTGSWGQESPIKL